MKDNDILDGKDDFIIWTPGCVVVDLSKGSAEIDRLRPIGGVCSTESLDRQNETVFAKGLDFREFVDYGWFNDNHKQGTADAVGVPTMAELRKGRWWTEGRLLQDFEPADRIWALAKALQKSGVSRRLGFSIEGKVTDRGFDNRVLKAKIRNVAITNAPVNTDCSWDILAKAFGSLEQMEAGAIKRALSAGAQSPAQSGGAALNAGQVRKRMDELTFDTAVKLVKSNRPHYSWATCERFVRIIEKQERRN